MIQLSDIDRQLVLAMLAQMTLAFVLLVLLPIGRITAMRAKKVTLDAVDRPIFPKWATQVADCFNNQFQMPVLFYALIVLALTLHATTQAMVWQAWAFVALRWVHASVFVTTNFVPLRFLSFLISCVLVLSIFLQIARPVLGF